MTFSKNCAVCGTTFNAVKGKQQVCSPECALAVDCIINPETGCWEKQNGLNPVSKHSRIGFDCVQSGGHRFSYELLVGPIPDGQFIRHKCDNPPCVNPDHLIPGSQQDNMDDMKARGRSLVGEKAPAAKLREEDAQQIYLSDENHERLANRFSVTPVTVRHIKEGVTWSHVTGHPKKVRPRSKGFQRGAATVSPSHGR